MVMENVPGMLNMVTPEGIPVVDAFTKVISDGGFGEYEALRKSLLSSSGCGAAIGNKTSGKPKTEQKRSPEKTGQRELFR